LVLRLIPVVAFNLVNYAAGLARISWWTFTWTTALGILPAVVLLVVLGNRLASLPGEVVLVVIAAVLVIWLAVRVLGRRASSSSSGKRTREDHSHSENR
jgi:uncharacterized membrane protein YdjX (TVP38/TMEM64 family)